MVRRNPPKLQSSFAKASEDTRIPPRSGDRGFLRRRVTPQMGDSLVRLSKAVSDHDTECIVLHRDSKEKPGFPTLRPGLKASSLNGFLDRIGRHGR